MGEGLRWVGGRDAGRAGCAGWVSGSACSPSVRTVRPSTSHRVRCATGLLRMAASKEPACRNCRKVAVGGLCPAHGEASRRLLRRKHRRHHGRPRYEMGRCGTQPRVRVGVGRGGKVGGGTRSSRPTIPRALRNSRAASTAVRKAGYAPSVGTPRERGIGTGQRWRLALALLTAGTPRRQNLQR